jgi:hypothetical protein
VRPDCAGHCAHTGGVCEHAQGIYHPRVAYPEAPKNTGDMVPMGEATNAVKTEAQPVTLLVRRGGSDSG